MPILPPNATNPYDTVEAVLQVARVRLNDAIQSINGEVLTDDAPFSQTIFNIAWRQSYIYLANLGDTNFIDRIELKNIPVVGNVDPASECWISWTEYWNGSASYTAPVLPQDFVAPLKVFERTSGSNQSFDCGEMRLCEDGLPTVPKQIRNRLWEWRAQKLCFPGSQQIEDLLVRYIKRQMAFIDVGDVRWFQQPVPYPDYIDGLAWIVAAEMSEPRGDLNADSMRSKGETALAKVFNRQVRREQRTTSRRLSYSGRGRRGWGYGNGV